MTLEDYKKIQTRGSRRKFSDGRARVRARQRALARMLYSEPGVQYLLHVTGNTFADAADLRAKVFAE